MIRSLVLVPTRLRVPTFSFMIARRAKRRSSASTRMAHADRYSTFPSISDDGRFVAFTSPADNLAPAPTPSCTDTMPASPCQEMYVRDRQTNTTTRESTNVNGDPANNTVSSPMISGDGRFVAFVSQATNLVPGVPACGCREVFVKDLVSGMVTLASANDNDAPGDADASAPFISRNGRYVVFYSAASNLGTNNPNHRIDVLLRDLVAQTTDSVDVSDTGQPIGSCGPPYGWPPFCASVSDDGQFVAFVAPANVVNDPSCDVNGNYECYQVFSGIGPLAEHTS